MRGEDVISPTANRNTPRNTRLADRVADKPRMIYPAAATDRPKRNEGIARRFSKIRDTTTWKRSYNNSEVSLVKMIHSLGQHTGRQS